MIVDKASLKAAREETHAAVQLIAMVPRHLLPTDPTDGTASLIWDDELNMLVAEKVDDLEIAYDLATQKICIYKGTSQVAALETIGIPSIRFLKT